MAAEKEKAVKLTQLSLQQLDQIKGQLSEVSTSLLNFKLPEIGSLIDEYASCF